jgi:uncharacterized protein
MRFGKTLGAAALALAVMQTGFGAASAQVLPPAPSAKSPTVAIGSEGTEKAAPDLAIISAGLISNDPSSEAAAANNNRDFAKIMTVLKKYSVPAKDIQTASVSVRPNYKYTNEGGEELDGYVASNTVTITMRDLTKIGNLMADLAAAGANSIGGPSFGLDDSEALRDKAREKAFDNAQRRALTYARKAGFKTVRLLTINESAGDMAYAYADVASAAADAAAGAMKFEVAPAAIEPGEVTETVYASFLFEMVP